MKIKITALMALFVALGAYRSSGQALDPNHPPGRNFNLTNFYLGLPVDSSGGTNGNSASIPAAQLTTGYSNALYFYTGPDGAMTFWAPVTGATTPNSSYPRSELREQISPPLNSSNWIPYGVHVLSAQCRVTEVPSSGKVIIGQIHCYTGNARPLLKLQYNNGVIEALVKTNSNYDPDYKFSFQNVGLGNPVNYQIQMENGLMTTSVNGSNRAINVFLTDPSWATNGLYFKAGSYCQDNTGPTNEGARVAFYFLTRNHAPSITNQPVSSLVLAGSSTNFSVNATGNGLLRFQWRLNATNLANATNATFTVTNAQPSDAGSYSVVVSDAIGTAASMVAILTINRPPAPGNIALVTAQEIPISTPVADLLATASDPDGDILSLGALASVSSNGGLVQLTHPFVWYTPAAGFVGADQWTYTLLDARGATAVGSVNVTVLSSNAVTLESDSQSLSESGVFAAVFTGVPGLRYTVDRSTNLAGPWELAFTNLTTGTNGFFELNDPNLPPRPQRFYRVRYP